MVSILSLFFQGLVELLTGLVRGAEGGPEAVRVRNYASAFAFRIIKVFAFVQIQCSNPMFKSKTLHSTKVRKAKVVVRHFPHEVSDLEPVLTLLEAEGADQGGGNSIDFGNIGINYRVL